MLLYRRLSRQDAIAALKAAQKKLQGEIAAFEGEFSELVPKVREAFSLGFRQLGLSFGPAVIATIPILFVVAWVATSFVYESPEPGEAISVTTQPQRGQLTWSEDADAASTDWGWTIRWPGAGETVTLQNGEASLLTLSSDELAAVIHERRWWNWLFANPAGYLPEGLAADIVRIDLPQREYLPFGPDWMRGWLFAFFGTFLLASIAFKFLLKIE